MQSIRYIFLSVLAVLFQLSASATIGASQTLSWFTARYEGNNTVMLSWETKVAMPGVSFNVERSTDGSAFALVSKVSQNNNGKRFMYLDDDFLSTDRMYYRVTLNFPDGHSEYSNTLTVEAEQAPKAYGFSAQQNPFTDILKVNIFQNGNSQGVVALVNSDGQMVRSQTVSLTDGYNGVELDDLQGLSAGNYYVTLQTTGKLSVVRAMKL